MDARLAGKLLTSPPAFLLAGLLDFALFLGGALRARLSRALARTVHPHRRE